MEPIEVKRHEYDPQIGNWEVDISSFELVQASGEILDHGVQRDVLVVMSRSYRIDTVGRRCCVPLITFMKPNDVLFSIKITKNVRTSFKPNSTVRLKTRRFWYDFAFDNDDAAEEFAELFQSEAPKYEAMMTTTMMLSKGYERIAPRLLPSNDSGSKVSFGDCHEEIEVPMDEASCSSRVFGGSMSSFKSMVRYNLDPNSSEASSECSSSTASPSSTTQTTPEEPYASATGNEKPSTTSIPPPPPAPDPSVVTVASFKPRRCRVPDNASKPPPAPDPSVVEIVSMKQSPTLGGDNVSKPPPAPDPFPSNALVSSERVSSVPLRRSERIAKLLRSRPVLRRSLRLATKPYVNYGG